MGFEMFDHFQSDTAASACPSPPPPPSLLLPNHMAACLEDYIPQPLLQLGHVIMFLPKEYEEQ